MDRENPEGGELMSEITLEFTVHGKAQPRGSKRPVPIHNRHTGQPLMKNGHIVTRAIDDNPKSGPWMQVVAQAAREAMEQQGIPLLRGPLVLYCTFFFPRPAGHFRNDGSLKPTARAYPAIAPDSTKLVRGLEDALNKVAFEDDSRIVSEFVHKRYGESAYAEVRIKTLPETVAEAFPELVKERAKKGGKAQPSLFNGQEASS